MKSVKDEERKMNPLFPRLHLSDAEKLGGPRPPPRNKMALCEQLSVPTQRGSLSLFSLSPNHGSSLLPSSSSNHATSHKRSVFSSFSSSSGGMNMNTTLRTVRQPIETTHCQTLCGTGHLKPADYRFKPQSFMNSKTTSVKKFGHEDDYIVPTLLQVGNSPNCGNREKITSLSTNSLGKLPTLCKKQPKQTDTMDLTPKHHFWDSTEENKLVTKVSKDCAKEPSPVFSARFCISEPVNNELAPLHLKRRTRLVDESSTLCDPNARLQQKESILQENIAHRDGIWAETENATRKKSANGIGTMTKCHEEQDYGFGQIGDVGNIGNFSDTFVVDSMSGLDIFPDEVVGLIGRKHFSNARRTIAHQQQAFAVQIFELHRLIKVQRLIAGSPDLLLEAGFYMDRPSTESSAWKKLPSEDLLRPPPSIAKPRVNSPKTDSPACFPAEITVRKSPPGNNDVDKRFTHQSNHKGNSVISPPPSMGPQHLHPPPGNQWLIPVRSPSEGLIYKPYTGPCPPAAALMAPIYCNHGLMNLTPTNENFPNTGYDFTDSYQQGIGIFPNTPINQTYFPPYGWPMIKSPSFNSAVSNGANVNFTLPYKPSCKISSQEKWAISADIQNLQEQRESELQGSTASSPLLKKQGGDELPLFPTAPTLQDLDHTAQNKSSDERIKVIKVVPHNPILALETAARIFQSIQEERKHND